MHIFKKIKKTNGRRHVYFLGVKIFSYKKKIHHKLERTLNQFSFKELGNGSEIQPGCRIYHPENISIGNNVRIGQGALIEGMGDITIKNNVILGPDVTIWTANHNYEKPEKLPYDEKVILKPVTIEDNVWIGGKSIILPGVTIHEGAVVGMGAVVTKDVPSGAVIGGNPAKVLKYRDMTQYEKLKLQKSFYIFKEKKE